MQTASCIAAFWRGEHKTRFTISATAILSLCCLFMSCAGPVKVRKSSPARTQKKRLQYALIGKRPSEAAMQTLRLYNMDESWQKNPLATLKSLEAMKWSPQNRDLIPVLAELALLQARYHGSKDQLEEASSFYLMAAARSYEYLFQSEKTLWQRALNPRFQQMQHIYARATGKYAVLAKERHQGELKSHLHGFPGTKVQVLIDRPAQSLDPNFYDLYIPASESSVSGLRNHYRQPGLGSNLTAIRERRLDQDRDRFIPPDGMIDPVTAVFRFHRPQTEADGDRVLVGELSFYDPRVSQTIGMDDATVPLSGDFTTPFAHRLKRVDPWEEGFESIMLPKGRDHYGLFLHEPYDPQKIPIILIHGMFSSPAAWMELTNDLAGNAHLRKHFQIWHYGYSTAYPFLYAAHQFRKALADIRLALDPRGEDPAMQSMILVAHSMGGLLAKSTVIHSKDALWQTMFNQPPSNLAGSGEDIAVFREMCFLEPLPYIHRIVFIATPHRGSEFTAGSIAKLGISLTRLPKDYTRLFQRVGHNNLTALTPFYREQFRKGGMKGIASLAPENPMMQRYGSLPIDRFVPVHSIISDRGRKNAPVSGDGIVSYQSAHLENAASEMIIRTDHSSYNHPLAIEEVCRILNEHLVLESGQPGF